MVVLVIVIVELVIVAYNTRVVIRTIRQRLDCILQFLVIRIVEVDLEL